MHITVINLFDHNVGMACAKVRLRCSCISLCINFFDHNVGMTCAKVRLRCSCILLVIDLFDHNVGMACAKVTLRCSFILLVLIYLITMWVWHVLKLHLDVHSYHCY